jgi:beta-N-acetylhexosaminidase
MSDDLGAADAAASLPAGERAVRFVAAGGDLVLTIRPQDAAPMSASLLAEARRSPVFAGRLTEAARHVLRAKDRAGLLKC